MSRKKFSRRFLIEPGSRVKLKDHDPGWNKIKELKHLKPNEGLRQKAQDLIDKNRENLAAEQEKLYADNRYALLVILQAMDAAGKDGTIKHVMSGVNPQGCQVYSFKEPSREELDHTFLWRYMKSLPERGRIGIFNRSYYEDVVAVKVHPNLLQDLGLPPAKQNKKFWQARYEDINAFERHLTRNGTVVLKFFLNLSKAEQKERFLERLNRPEKNWKFSFKDLQERDFWRAYQSAYEEALSATSTPWAPWNVVPADHKWVARVIVGDVIVNALRSLDLDFPEASAKLLVQAKRELSAE